MCHINCLYIQVHKWNSFLPLSPLPQTSQGSNSCKYITTLKHVSPSEFETADSSDSLTYRILLFNQVMVLFVLPCLLLIILFLCRLWLLLAFVNRIISPSYFFLIANPQKNLTLEYFCHNSHLWNTLVNEKNIPLWYRRIASTY